MNSTFAVQCRLNYLLIIALISVSISIIPTGSIQAQDGSGMNLKIYGSDPDNAQNEYTLESDPKDADKKYIIKLIMVLKNISDQKIHTERGFGQVELHRALVVKDPCGNPLELSPDATPYAFDGSMPRFVAGRALIPAETQEADFARSLTIDDLREWFPLMYELPGKYTVTAQLKGARFVLTESDEKIGLQGVANHRSSWFGTIDAKVGVDEKTELTLLILPVSGGRFKVTLEKLAEQSTTPLFGVPVKAFRGSITDDPANAWEEIEPALTGTSDAQGEVTWKCDKCLPLGDYTIIAKYQEEFQVSQISNSDSDWNTECSGVIKQRLAFSEEEPQPNPSEHLEIGNFSLISKKRVSRVEYDYTYKADVTNSGQDVQNVHATVSSNSPYTTVVDDSVNFGDVPSGSTVSSTDTFTIRQNRRYPFDWSDLEWEIHAEIP